jgi:hypothetical protein
MMLPREERFRLGLACAEFGTKHGHTPCNASSEGREMTFAQLHMEVRETIVGYLWNCPAASNRGLLADTLWWIHILTCWLTACRPVGGFCDGRCRHQG